MIKKAQEFCDEAERNGWSTSVQMKNDDETHVRCIRNNEEITIWWKGNKLVEVPFHIYQGQQRGLHNKATATRQLSLKPNAKSFKVITRTRFQKLAKDPKTGEAVIPDGASIEDLKHDLPFDPNEDTDSAILKELRGSTIVFVNRISGSVESVNIPRLLNMDLNKFYLEESVDGKLYVSFLAATGFRSVYIDSILQVM